MFVVEVTEHVLEKMFEAQAKDAVLCARVYEAYDRHKDAVPKYKDSTATFPLLKQLDKGRL